MKLNAFNVILTTEVLFETREISKNSWSIVYEGENMHNIYKNNIYGTTPVF